MKIFGLVLVMLFVAAGAGVADTATIDIYSGWNMLSAPLVPFDPDPYTLFDGWDVDGRMSRIDAVTGGMETLGVGDFGNILLGDGFWWKNNYAGGELNYEGVADGIPTGVTPSDMWISLPGKKEPTNLDNGGWHMIGCPYQHDVSLDKIFFTNGSDLKSWEAAKDALWVADYMNFYAGGLDSLIWDGGGGDDMMRGGKGYYLRTFKDDLAMIVIGN